MLSRLNIGNHGHTELKQETSEAEREEDYLDIINKGSDSGNTVEAARCRRKWVGPGSFTRSSPWGSLEPQIGWRSRERAQIHERNATTNHICRSHGRTYSHGHNRPSSCWEYGEKPDSTHRFKMHWRWFWDICSHIRKITDWRPLNQTRERDVPDGWKWYQGNRLLFCSNEGGTTQRFTSNVPEDF